MARPLVITGRHHTDRPLFATATKACVFIGLLVSMSCGESAIGSSALPTQPSTVLTGGYSLLSVNGMALPVSGSSGQVTGGAIVTLGGDTVKVTHVVSGNGTVAIQVATYHATVNGPQLILSPIIANYVDTGEVAANSLVLNHHTTTLGVEVRAYIKN